jgi:hypothetical protein
LLYIKKKELEKNNATNEKKYNFSVISPRSLTLLKQDEDVKVQDSLSKHFSAK